jgi:hypothetical protein
VNAKESSASSHGATLRDWYSDKLRPKLARAVTEGRVGAAQAAQLHRLMTELVEVDLRHANGVKRSRRVDGQASR